MTLLLDDVRLLIRRMFFTERFSIEQIAACTGFSARTVRRALVIDGGVRVTGPYHQEDESDRHST
jgi:hypothetical protein